MLALCAMLGKTLALPILELAFAFCDNEIEWANACLACPVKTAHLPLMLTAKARERKDRTKPTTPASAVHSLCIVATPVLQKTAAALLSALHSFTNMSAQIVFLDSVFHVSLEDIVQSAAPQYRRDQTDDVISKTTLASVPTTPSLPDYTPNFTRDDRIQWIRTAEHKFKNVIFPAKAIVRGDVNSEILFHQYCRQVLHNRTLCMELSEHQVIEHLLLEFRQYDTQFTIAHAKFQEPDCTVRAWLDSIRSAFFTSGQFRLNIEHAWHNYKAGSAKDFNDLLQHVHTYYQLIFLDYASLPGKMALHDFAWHLFDKISHLIDDGHSLVAHVLRKYFPHTELIQQMNTKLEFSNTASTHQQDHPAQQFLNWCLRQLQIAKASANTAQRLHARAQSHAETTADFVNPQQPRSTPPIPTRSRATEQNVYRGVDMQARAGRSAPPVMQALSSMQPYAASPPPRAGYGTRQGPAPRQYTARVGNRSPAPSTQPGRGPRRRPLRQLADPWCSIPNLREIFSDLPQDPQRRLALARRLTDAGHTPQLQRILRRELELVDHPSTLHRLMQANGQRYTPNTPADAVLYYLKSYYLHREPACCACFGSLAARKHLAVDCPTLTSNCPGAALEWSRDPDNTGCFSPTSQERSITAEQHRQRQHHGREPTGAPAAGPYPTPADGTYFQHPRSRYRSTTPVRDADTKRSKNEHIR